MLLLGAVLIAMNAGAAFDQGLPAITFAVMIPQAAALVLLFTKQSSVWFRHRVARAGS